MTDNPQLPKGFPIAFEKLLLWIVIASIWVIVILMEHFVPHQSAPLVMVGFMGVYGLLIGAANLHRKRQVLSGKLHPPENPDYKPSVSVIIAAHNEEFVIEDTLNNLLQLDYPDFDLWVFNDRSKDGTQAVLDQFKTHTNDVRLHIVHRADNALPGKSAVLNEALEKTRGEIIVVFDADGRVQPNFLTRILPYLAEAHVGAVQVRKVIQNAKVNLLTRCQAHEYMLDAQFQMGRDTIKGAVELRGNGEAIKREALLQVDGWNDETITDDLDLSTKLHIAGWDIRFAPDVTVEEEGIVAFVPLLKQRRRWAEGSLKRYLEYSVPIFTSKAISHRAQLDMLAYFIKFLFPLWVIADLGIQTLNWFYGVAPDHLFSTAIVFPVLCFFFLSAAYAGIRHFTRARYIICFGLAIETALLLTAIWVPVVMWITAKILITPDNAPLNWGKTEHLGTQIVVKQSKLRQLMEQLKQELTLPL